MPGNTIISIKDGTVGIAERAFFGCSRMISVIIPSSVKSIGEYAFAHCNNLTFIEMSVDSIGEGWFSGCSGLTTIELSNSVNSIGYNAFGKCSGLTSVTIPNSVTFIAPAAFEGCIALNSIRVESDNPQYDSRNDCNAIIETSSNTLIAGCKNTTFPSSVTSIGDCAFSGHTEITTISIPNNVTSIGIRAFSLCSGLTSIDIPNSVTFIGGEAFHGCISLTSIDIPNSLSSIGGFQGSGLTFITIPCSVTTIYGTAFANCIDLFSVTIPNSVTSIDGWAFGNCRALSDFYSWAEILPSTHRFAFDGTPCGSATLHVPVGSVDAYKNTYPWSLFGTIVALTDDDPKPTGIESLKEEILTYPVGTYSIDGKRLQKAQRGLNIIRMNDGKTIKRIVK